MYSTIQKRLAASAFLTLAQFLAAHLASAACASQTISEQNISAAISSATQALAAAVNKYDNSRIEQCHSDAGDSDSGYVPHKAEVDPKGNVHHYAGVMDGRGDI